jgi:hypothetical protein
VSVGEHRSPPRRDWDAEPNVLRARVLLADDRCRAAVKEAWKAALVAVNADDDDGLAAVGRLALEIEERATGRARDEAGVLASYVEHCRDTAASGAPQGGLLARLFGVRKPPRTKACPRCAEQVRERARICRFCNYEFPDT